MFLVCRVRYIIFFLVWLCGATCVSIVHAQQEAPALGASLPVLGDDIRLTKAMKKYATYIDDYQPDENIQKWLVEAEHCAERYTDDNFLDHLLNAEAYRQQDQLAFNSKILYQYDVPLGEQSFSVALRNSDLGKMLFVALDWGIEWHVHRHMLGFWSNFVVDQLMQQRKEYAGALQAIQESLDKGDDQALEKAVTQIHRLVFDTGCKEIMGQMTRELLPSLGVYLFLSHTFEVLKKYYLLDRSYAQNILMLLATSVLGIKKFDAQDPLSVFELVEGNWISGMPLTVFKTGFLDQINGLLQRYGMLPEWSSGNAYLFVRRVAFMFLFMRWSIKSFLQPMLFEIVMNNRQALLKNLQTTGDNQQVSSSITKNQDELKKMLRDGYASTFPLWLGFKAEKYASWQTMLNVVIMLPAIVTLARKIYVMVQQFNAQNNAPAKPIAVADNGGVR